MGTGEKAWAVLVGGIIVYEAITPEEDMLSRAVDRALVKHPVMTTAAISLTALHLLNVMERMGPFGKLDPWVLAFAWRKWLR